MHAPLTMPRVFYDMKILTGIACIHASVCEALLAVQMSEMAKGRLYAKPATRALAKMRACRTSSKT